MFGLFTSRRHAEEAHWRCHMGWRVLTYEERGDAADHVPSHGKYVQWLSLQIEPMKEGACIVYVPANTWRVDAPHWARDRRAEILGHLRGIRWNRDLEWRESERARFWHRHIHVPVEGSIESTPGGMQLEGMRLFHPDSPARFSKRDAKRAWCAACEQMCLQISGPVQIDESEVIPGSVFQEIELATLRRNPNVSLRFASAG